MDRFALSIFNEFKSNHVTLSEAETVQLSQTVSSIDNELTTQDHFYRETVFHYFTTILLLVERLRRKQHTLPTPTIFLSYHFPSTDAVLFQTKTCTKPTSLILDALG